MKVFLKKKIKVCKSCLFNKVHVLESEALARGGCPLSLGAHFNTMIQNIDYIIKYLVKRYQITLNLST